MNYLKNIKHKIILFLLLAFSFFLIFFNLGKPDLGHYREEYHDNALPKQLEWTRVKNDYLKNPMHYNYLNYHEYRYSTVVQQVIETNNWKTLTVPNLGSIMPYYMKGPVYFLLTAVTAKIFGFSKFVVRFWPALSAFSTVILIYFLSKDIFNKKVGLLSIFILSTTFQFIHIDGARVVAVDTMFLFFTILSIYLLFKQKRNTKFVFFAFFFMGLAALTRSVFIAIPLLIVLSFLYFYLNYHKINNKKILLRFFFGIFIFIFIVLPWVGLQYILGGENYLVDIKRFQWQEEFLDKLKLSSSAMYEKFQYSLFFEGERPREWNFYLWTIFKGFFPWSIFIVLALIYSVKIGWQKKDKKIFSIVFIIFSLYLFVSIKAQNWSRYAINFYPFFSILLGKLLYDFYRYKKDIILKLGLIVTFFLFSPFIIGYNFNNIFFKYIYILVFLYLLLYYFILSKYAHKNNYIIPFLLIVHFGILAIINVLQPFFI
jgi:4-amino-4-deoxy-L-arabinose transferase-like glycosyltransferase